MRKYTTPTLNITIKNKSGEVANDLVFDYLIFSLKTGSKRIDKRVEFADVTDGAFQVSYTQEETGSLPSMQVRAEINLFIGDVRVASTIKEISLNENLLNEVVE